MGKYDGFYQRVINLDDIQIMGKPQPVRDVVDQAERHRVRREQRAQLGLPPIRA